MYISKGIIIREFEDKFLIIDTLDKTNDDKRIVYIENDRSIGTVVAQLPKPFNTLKINQHNTTLENKKEE